jgi:hypothetical protein
VFEKSVQILALAISDLITDKYFELEGLFESSQCSTYHIKNSEVVLIEIFTSSEKSEALLSNVANLMETFEERQNSVTETLNRFLAGRLPPSCRSFEV